MIEENNLMKKIIALIIIIAIIASVAQYFEKKERKAIASDYEKIETVQNAVISSINSGAHYSYSDRHQWYLFDLRVIYESNEGFYKSIRNILGEDFNSKLSTGDYIFVGILPFQGSYRIYAGDPQNENNMIFPDWNYKKLKEPTP